MSKSLLETVIDKYILTDAVVGKIGEKRTENELKLVQLLGRKGKVLRNIYLPKENGETSEVDVIFITQKGIFVFESKNYSGWIFGDEDNQYWTVSLPNGTKNKFYNPIKQNKTHMKWMSQYIGAEIPLFSIIAFSERCELKKITVKSENVKVINRELVYSTVRNIWNKVPDVLDEAQIEELFEKLQILTNVDEATKAAHVENINKRFKSEKKENTEIVKNESLICPKCGSLLVLRTAKNGANAGKQFYGCSKYPYCKYVLNINSEN